MIFQRYPFDLVAAHPIEMDDEDMRKVQFLLREFQPASSVKLLNGEVFAIRVAGRGPLAEVAPGILQRVEDIVGQRLDHRPIRGSTA